MKPHTDAPPSSSALPLLDPLMKVQRFLAELIVVVMAVMTAAEVLCRSLLGFSLLITEEVGGYLLVALVFFGMGLALYDGKLFRVEFVMQRLVGRTRLAIQLIFNLLSLAFAVMLAYQMFALVSDSHARNVHAATMLATPEYIPQIAMAVGATTMALVLLSQSMTGFAALFGKKS